MTLIIQNLCKSQYETEKNQETDGVNTPRDSKCCCPKKKEQKISGVYKKDKEKQKSQK